MRSTGDRVQKLYLAVLGGAAVVAALAVAFAATLAGTSGQRPPFPDNTAEPRISGTPRR